MWRKKGRTIPCDMHNTFIATKWRREGQITSKFYGNIDLIWNYTIWAYYPLWFLLLTSTAFQVWTTGSMMVGRSLARRNRWSRSPVSMFTWLTSAPSAHVQLTEEYGYQSKTFFNVAFNSTISIIKTKNFLLFGSLYSFIISLLYPTVDWQYKLTACMGAKCAQ